MAAVCAFRPCAVDAESPLPIATRDVELLGDRLRRMRKGQDWESVRSDLIESVDIARGNGGAHHQPRLRPRPGTAAMHSTAIVPQGNVAGSPPGGIDVSALRRRID